MNSFFHNNNPVVLSFAKYQANGNDFILIEDINNWGEKIISLAPKLCHRNTGIGADGIILLSPDLDLVKARVINQDGSEAQNCGNGLRAVAHWYFEKNKAKLEIKIELASKKYACRKIKNKIFVNMGLCKITKITKAKFAGKNLVLNFCDIGNKHIVVTGDGLNNCEQIISFIREKISEFNNYNIGLVDFNNYNISSRVFERGVGWTKSCGSGAAAAALVWHKQNIMAPKACLRVSQPGGDLEIISRKFDTSNLDLEFSIEQSGPVQKVFKGACCV